MTRREIQENFERAFRNWQHELVEHGYWVCLPHAEDARKWRAWCNDAHAIINGRKETPDAGNSLLAALMAMGVSRA